MRAGAPSKVLARGASMLRFKFAGIIMALLLVGAPILALADAAGTAQGVNPAATAGLNGTPTRTLTVGADIFIGDLVETGDVGLVQIRFADNTELVIGPNSKLTIEDYLIRNDGSAGMLAVNMLSGAFRFATGDAAKNRYKITTPTGTIGVRGTGFDVFVDALTGFARILMYHGKVRLCTFDGVCQELSDLCAVGEIQSSDTVVLGDSHKFKGEERDKLKADFIYALNQSPLLRQFWMAHANECVNNPPDVGVAEHADVSGGKGGSTSSASEEPPPSSSSSSVPPSSSSSSSVPPSSSSSSEPSSSSSSSSRPPSSSSSHTPKPPKDCDEGGEGGDESEGWGEGCPTD